MNFSQTTDAPVMVNIDGVQVSFPVWTIEELSKLCAKLDARRVEIARRTCRELTLDRIDQASLLQQAQFLSSTPSDVYRYFQSHDGAIECLLQSLVKSSKTGEESRAIVARLYGRELVDLAVQVGRLVRPVLPKAAHEPDPTQKS
jgi:hypothetical protein